MSEASPPPDDRWQQVFQALDPERNIRAVSDLMEQFAAGSQQAMQAVSGSATGTNGEVGSNPYRDAFANFERSIAQLYDAAGRFMVERPLRGAAGGPGHAGATAEIHVIDGVGTTSIEIPDAEHDPHCGELRSADGNVVPADAVSFTRSALADSNEPTFVIKVATHEDTAPGIYHGQILVDGLGDRAYPLVVLVEGPADE